MKYMVFSVCMTLLLALFMIDCEDQTGAGSSDDSVVRVVDARASECHGFVVGKIADEGDGFDDEILFWTYDSATERLTLHHAALVLNCCGAHSIDAVYADGIVTLYEDDQPDPELGRCHCICPFDFLVTLEGIPEETTGIRIMLTVDDETTEHWAGAIEPAEGSGYTVITSRNDIP